VEWIENNSVAAMRRHDDRANREENEILVRDGVLVSA
jgi:hypothetical protein